MTYSLQGKNIALGVTGSIACYKAVDLASKLVQLNADVDVLMTDAALQFLTPLTLRRHHPPPRRDQYVRPPIRTQHQPRCRRRAR